MLSLAAGLAAQSAVLTTACVRVDLRWPNDLMVGSQKVGGILVETSAGSGSNAPLHYAVIGIGINVNHASFPAKLSVRSQLRCAWLRAEHRSTASHCSLPCSARSTMKPHSWKKMRRRRSRQATALALRHSLHGPGFTPSRSRFLSKADIPTNCWPRRAWLSCSSTPTMAFATHEVLSGGVRDLLKLTSANRSATI